jgi:hypothetical protein
MTTEEHLKLIIGNLNFQIAVLSAELDKAKAALVAPTTP